jgi:hypothetical protein
MEQETQQFEEIRHSGYAYIEPDGKGVVDFSQSPEPGEDVSQEMGWHMENKAYRNVAKTDGSGWSKEDVLDAISGGHADAFTINRFRFPPSFDGTWITEHFPMQFDDRDFGERLANRVLQGFNREPRSQS